MDPRIVFAISWQKISEPVGQRFADLTAWLTRESGLSIIPRCALSYEELARMLRSHEAHLAWLPPIVFLRLEHGKVAAPLVSHRRSGHSTFQSVLVVRASSPIQSLDGMRGARAAWVDPWSAAGYVLPRLELWALGMDPRTMFSKETFFGSHDGAVRALLADEADVVATFAQRESDGSVSGGGWSKIAGADDTVRVLATFGAIPNDVIVGRSDLTIEKQGAIARALVAASKDAVMAKHLEHIFGVAEFREVGLPNYYNLRRSLESATAAGLVSV
ncbi:MAG: PhnD/SsuA/transferrin family substrate-binding protein [Polyangiaceae bacterium]